MKKLVLTMASLVMLASMAFAQETPMLPESHGLTVNQPAWGGSQTFDLSSGWTWLSTYVTVPDIQTMEAALGEDGLTIKAVSNQVEKNSEGVWVGDLSSIEFDEMYAVQMANAATVTLRGSRAVVSAVDIPANPGWNWIGYPVAFTSPFEYAIGNYTPADQDVVKGFEDMMQYDALTQTWTGGLTELEPGKGYKLLSNNNSASTFNYPAVPANRGMYIQKPNNTTEWQPQQASNPNNMNMIAVITLDNEELRSDNVEIGVFNGETCRGAKSPMYVESTNQYLVFLTMYGENNEPYSFRLLDKETGNVYESNEAPVSFKADAVIGGVRTPFTLNFSSKNSFAGALNLFPNPVNRGEMVNLTLPAEGTVEVVNVLGSTMKRVRMAEGTQLAADMAPGIYTIKVTDAEGNVYVDKLVVK